MDTNKRTTSGKDERWVGFDLDGTLAKYDGWKGDGHIGEPIKPMVDLAKRLHANGKKVKILTARVAPSDGKGDVAKPRLLISLWCRKHLGFVPEISCEKDQFMELLYDDRARQVEENKGKVVK